MFPYIYAYKTNSYTFMMIMDIYFKIGIRYTDFFLSYIIEH